MAEVLRKITDRVGEQGLVWLVNLVLLALLGQSIAAITWQALGDKQQDSPQPASQRPVASRPVTKPVTVMAQQIASQHLFGEAGSSRGQVASAPETKLNLVLKGVIAAGHQSAVAFIAPGAAALDKAYGLGDNLPGGAILKEVYEDRILLEYRGRMETLSLRRKSLSSKELSIQK